MCDELTYQATLEVLKDTRARLELAEAVCDAAGAVLDTVEGTFAGDKAIAVLSQRYGAYRAGKEDGDVCA